MAKLLAPLAVATLVLATPAAASHFLNPGPYVSRGDCEAEKAELSNEDRDGLLERFPQLFSSRGEVRSFLNRAFTCELNPADEQWYLIDRRLEILESEWFLRRL